MCVLTWPPEGEVVCPCYAQGEPLYASTSPCPPRLLLSKYITKIANGHTKLLTHHPPQPLKSSLPPADDKDPKEVSSPLASAPVGGARSNSISCSHHH